jgi:hypothetical protein
LGNPGSAFFRHDNESACDRKGGGLSGEKIQRAVHRLQVKSEALVVDPKGDEKSPFYFLAN